MTSIPLKTCSICKQAFPATPEYFHKRSDSRDGLMGLCKECNRAKAKQWGQDNSARAVERVRQWRIDHPDKYQDYNERTFDARMEKKRQWRKDHPELVKKHKSESQKRNRPSANKRSQRNRAKDPQRYNQLCRDSWHRRKEREGTDFIRVANHKRRTRKLMNGGEHSRADIRNLLIEQDGRCGYCGILLGRRYHIDHIVPLSRGGSNGVENLMIACADCNQHKADKTFDEWLAVRGW